MTLIINWITPFLRSSKNSRAFKPVVNISPFTFATHKTYVHERLLALYIPAFFFRFQIVGVMYKYDDPKDIQYQVRNITSSVNQFVQPGFGDIFVELLCRSQGG